MFTITMQKECGCFRRSEFSSVSTFETKDEALMEAQAMAEDMNDTFCQKHTFAVVEDGDNFVITMEMN